MERTGRKAVRIFLPTSNGNYLLQKALTNAKYSRVPGGGVNEDESFEQAAIRELKEEFNIDAKGKLTPLGWHTLPQFNEFYYLCKDHGLKPGKYQDKDDKSVVNELINKRPGGKYYWGPDLQKLLSKQAAEAKGIPDRKYYGSIAKDFSAGQVIDYVIQKHNANRAGTHYDLRAGTKDKGLHSWVTRKQLPEAGGNLQLFHQPVHSYKYKDFEGTIGPGYGAGTVTKVTDGKLLITKADKNSIHFTTADNKPEKRYAILRIGKELNQWLLARPHNISYPNVSKPKMKSIPPEELDRMLSQLKGDENVQVKVDGALNFVQLLKNKPEILSYRLSKETGLPIVHTERFFHGRPELKDLPSKYKDAVLLAEVYGDRKGKAIPPQELGGILNSTIDKSIAGQSASKTELKAMLFDVAKLGDKIIDPNKTSYPERYKVLEDIIKYLPKGKFELPEQVKGPEAAKYLLKRIRSGHHPKSEEGLVIHPNLGRSSKAKLTDETDVYVQDVFPGFGKYSKMGAGGFKYSLTPRGKIVGKVGTGLSDDLRRDMFKNPEDYIGRTARIKSLGQFKETGAYRAPSLVAIHQDY